MSISVNRSKSWWYVPALGCSLFLITASLNLQLPLFTVYAQNSGYGTGVATLVFSCHIIGLLPILIFLGGLSDRIGRKSPIILGLLLTLVATGIVITYPVLPAVTFARFLLGCAVGISLGAGTAFIAELLMGQAVPERAAAIVTATTSIGFGSGALLTSMVISLQGTTVRPISYAIYMPLALACLATICLIPEKRSSMSPALLRLPYFPAGTQPYHWAIGMGWAVTGMIIAIIPSELIRHGLLAWSGATLFILNLAGLLSQPFARRLKPREAILLGLLLVPTGYGIVLLGIWYQHITLILIGAAVAGSACYGFTYLGGLAIVSVHAGIERARATSGYFLSTYLGLCVPVIICGFIADVWGLHVALLLFGLGLVIGHLILFLLIIGRANSFT